MADGTTWHRLQTAHAAAAIDGRPSVIPEHHPNAAILACSDARVPPSIVFDQPAGSLFVVRIAGNTACASALASLDFAVDSLDTDLIVVLGHTGCGAVSAAAAGTCGGHLAPIVETICQIAREYPQADVDTIVALNVAATMRELAAHSGPVGVAYQAGQLEIRGAVHDLRTGYLIPIPIDFDQQLGPTKRETA